MPAGHAASVHTRKPMAAEAMRAVTKAAAKAVVSEATVEMVEVLHDED